MVGLAGALHCPSRYCASQEFPIDWHWPTFEKIASSCFVIPAWVSHLSFSCFLSFTLLHSILCSGAVTLWLSTKWRHASRRLSPSMNTVFPYFAIVAQFFSLSTTLSFSGFSFTLDSILCDGGWLWGKWQHASKDEWLAIYLFTKRKGNKKLQCTLIGQATSPDTIPIFTQPQRHNST